MKRFLKRLVVTVLFIPLLLWEVFVWGWLRWLLTGTRSDLDSIESLKEWAE